MGKVPNIANIWGIPSCLVIRNAGFVVDCPNYSGIFTCKSRENMDLDLATIIMWFNMSKSDICIHV